jgi:hypothetical protein
MACSKDFRHDIASETMYAEYKKKFDKFFFEKNAACRAVQRQLSLTLCFDEMMKYEEEPFFLDVVRAMLHYCMLRQDDEVVLALQQMVRVRMVLQQYDWNKLRAQLEEYSEFHGIVKVFMYCIRNTVLDMDHWCFRSVVTHHGAASGGMTRQEFLEQHRLILGNMGDAGVVECIWTVCRHHSTFLPTQQKLIHVLCEMSESRSVCHVRNILKIPGHMRMLRDVSCGVYAVPPTRDNLRGISRYTLRHYVSLIRVMFDSDPVFTANEEIQVVNIVHDIIAVSTDLRIHKAALRALLSVISDRVRTSTLCELTDAQIQALCGSTALQSDPMLKHYVSTLIYRARTAKGIFDFSDIPDGFSLPDR